MKPEDVDAELIAWQNNPEAQKRFQEELRRLDEVLRPYQEALDRTEQLTAEDFAVTINTRD